MKGKELLKKIYQPSLIFLLGILIIVCMFATFISLFVIGLRKIDMINEQIFHIDYQIFNNVKKEKLTDTDLITISRDINLLLANPSLNILFTTRPNLQIEKFEAHIKNKADLYEAFELIHNLSKYLHTFESQQEKSFGIFYLLVTIMIIILIIFLVISQYESYKIIKYEQLCLNTNNKLYDQLEKERSLIAFELHDDIAQKLALIKRYFSNKNSIDDHTNLMEQYSSEVITRVRYLSRMLKAPDNPHVSFNEYLETLFSDFNVLSGFKLNRKTVGLNALKLEPSASLHIYRIIQEILSNSRIHSEATEIDLLLVYSHPTLNIKYKDNGKGFDPYRVYRKGIGLDSIKYRLEILKGDYRLNSKEGEGTDITIDIPVELCEIY